MTNSNTSATGGYLSQSPASVPLTQAQINALLHDLVSVVCGIDPKLVRPRWQPSPGNRPAADVDWCGIGITQHDPDDNAGIVHRPDGSDLLYRQERLTVLASFYGPNSDDLAGQLRDGLYVAQNREKLQINNIGFTDARGPVRVPELVNQQWIDRGDVTITFARQVLRSYPVFNLVEAVGEIEAEEGFRLYVRPLDINQQD